MKIEDLLTSDAWIYLATTGGGAGAQDMLWSVPGASAYLAGACFPYDSDYELPEFIGYAPPQYVCEETAVDMAIAAFMRASLSCKPGRVPVGVGCTASVATLKDHRGDHRSWTAVITGHGNGRLLLECQGYEKVGPKGRVADGAMVDFRIVDMILRAVSGVGSNYLGSLEEHILRRPLYCADGRRGAEPVGPLSLMPGSFNPVHLGHLENVAPDTIFQISLGAPHKPSVSPVDALRRVALIRQIGHDALVEQSVSYYIDKARKWPGSTIYLGSDAFARLLDPRWYSLDSIDPVLEEFHKLMTTFKISQRDGDPDVAKLIESTPGPWKNGPMFQIMPPSKYAHFSSTQLREKADQYGG